MARKSGGTNEKTEYWADEIIATVREGGVPCNRTSIKEAALKEAIKKRTNTKGEIDVEGLVTLMKNYHGSNPDKLDKKIAALKAKYDELVAAREEIEEE